MERELLGDQGFLVPLLHVTQKKRITNIDAKPNFAIIGESSKELIDLKVNLKEPNVRVPFENNLRFIGLSSSKNGGFGLYPPFDIANLASKINEYTQNVYRVPFFDLEFYLVKL